MRSKRIQAGHRRAVVWYALGMVAVQAILTVGVDAYWPAVRDPDFADLRQIVSDRIAEAPGRPLVFVFGSSRMKSDLRVEALNRPQDLAAPLAINVSASGAGPMAQDVFLGRWLDAGIRPSLIFLEITPMSLSIKDGATIEEPKMNAQRYSMREAAHIWPYYNQPIHLCSRLSLARALPCHYNRTELRDALGLDVQVGVVTRPSGRDDFGWSPAPGGLTREEMDLYLKRDLETYHLALTQPTVAPGAMDATRSFVNRCLKERIKIFLILPPESSGFRYYCPTASANHIAAIRGLATELGVQLLDHSDWVEDEGFCDGHHTNPQGTESYTRRFASQVFEPMMATAFSPSPRAQMTHKSAGKISHP